MLVLLNNSIGETMGGNLGKKNLRKDNWCGLKAFRVENYVEVKEMEGKLRKKPRRGGDVGWKPFGVKTMRRENFEQQLSGVNIRQMYFLLANFHKTDFLVREWVTFSTTLRHSCIKVTKRKLFIFFSNWESVYYDYKEESP